MKYKILKVICERDIKILIIDNNILRDRCLEIFFPIPLQSFNARQTTLKLTAAHFPLRATCDQ